MMASSAPQAKVAFSARASRRDCSSSGCSAMRGLRSGRDALGLAGIDRQGHSKGRAPSQLALHCDVAAEYLTELLGDGEPQASSPVFSAGVGAGLGEGLEEASALLLGHADAG